MPEECPSRLNLLQVKFGALFERPRSPYIQVFSETKSRGLRGIDPKIGNILSKNTRNMSYIPMLRERFRSGLRGIGNLLARSPVFERGRCHERAAPTLATLARCPRAALDLIHPPRRARHPPPGSLQPKANRDGEPCGLAAVIACGLLGGVFSAWKVRFRPLRATTRRASPADIAIWPTANGNCWGPDMMPVNAPLAALEWKVDRPGKAKQKPDGDRAWLAAFTEQNPTSLGFVVLVDFADGGVLRRLSVSRCEGRAWDEEWLVQPSRET